MVSIRVNWLCSGYRLWVGAALVTLGTLLPMQALAHTALTSASPASGERLNEVPGELRLRFNASVESSLARVVLIDAAGAEVRLGDLQNAADSARVLIAPIQGSLSAGTYTVRWQVAGADGHPVRGEYTFLMEPGASGLAPDPAPTAVGQTAPASEHHHSATSFPTGGAFDASSPLYVAIRWLTFVGLLGTIGAVAFRLLVLPLAQHQQKALMEPLAEFASRRAARLGLWMAGVVGVAALLRLYAQSYALHGPEAVWNIERVTTLLVQTTWGWGWLLQVTGMALALIGLVWALHADRTGWGVAAAGALALSFSPGLSGHAAASGGLATLAVLADGFHVLGAGGWLGSLLLLVVAGIPAARTLERETRGRAIAGLVNAFSPTALVFAGVVVVTGLFAAWLHLGSLAGLWESGYGRTLLLKLGILSVVFATGAYNWLKIKPVLGTQEATGKLQRSATLELAVGVLVLAVTAALVATSPPADTGMAEQADTAPVTATELTST